MRLLVEIFNTGDYRHLLMEYDDSISNDDLEVYFDAIMAEFSQLSPNGEYDYHLQKLDDKLYKEFVLSACCFAVKCLEIGCIDDAKSLIKDFKLRVKIDESKLIDYDAIEKLARKIKQIQTTLKLKAKEEIDNRKKSKKILWEDLIVEIHQVLNTSIDYNCPVTLYISYKKQKDLILEARKKQSA